MNEWIKGMMLRLRGRLIYVTTQRNVNRVLKGVDGNCRESNNVKQMLLHKSMLVWTGGWPPHENLPTMASHNGVWQHF